MNKRTVFPFSSSPMLIRIARNCIRITECFLKSTSGTGSVWPRAFQRSESCSFVVRYPERILSGESQLLVIEPESGSLSGSFSPGTTISHVFTGATAWSLAHVALMVDIARSATNRILIEWLLGGNKGVPSRSAVRRLKDSVIGFDPARGQGLVKGFHRVRGRLGLTHVQPFQVLQLGQRLESRVGNARRADPQRLQVRERLEVRDARVGQPCSVDPECPETRETGQRLQPVVGQSGVVRDHVLEVRQAGQMLKTRISDIESVTQVNVGQALEVRQM